MSEYFRIGFINCSLKGKSLFDYKYLFTPNEHKKNYKIILKDFRQNLNNSKYIVMFAINIENLKN